MISIRLRLLRLPTQRHEYLLAGLLASLVLHAAMLAWRGADPDMPVRQPQTLDIALVNTETKLAPLEPEILAQADLLGGGHQDQGQAASPIPRTVQQTSDPLVLAALRERQQALEARQEQLLATLERLQQARPGQEGSPTPAQPDTAGDDLQQQDSLILAAEIARIKQKIEAYNRKPRQTFIGPSARSDAHARYLEVWRTRIEALGTEHYPEAARGRIYGSLQLTAYIDAQGRLVRVEIDRPSEYAILNLAAQRIVQLAAPFAPLPPEIARDTDVLAITRTWHFQNQQLDTYQP